MRADQLLVERGLAASRAQAQRLIAAGGVRWRAPGGLRPVAKNGDELPATCEIELHDAAEALYVSRGGLKLEGALRAAGIDAAGKRCLDVGQSTGGFTDCLLAHGAAHVTGVDVGHGQLHPRLAQDARVSCIERVNARHLVATDFVAQEHYLTTGNGRFGPESAAEAAPAFDLVVGDVSFISLTLVLPALVPLLAPHGELLMLVKPQFELQPADIGKGGIVREPALHARVERRLREACAALGLQVAGWHDSPITGGDGNREFFIHARPQARASTSRRQTVPGATDQQGG